MCGTQGEKAVNEFGHDPFMERTEPFNPFLDEQRTAPSNAFESEDDEID